MSAQGQFLGRFVVELLRDDEAGLWEHRARSGYRDKNGREYWCEEGDQTDFCTVPRIAVIYAMLGNRARRSGAVHDKLYSPTGPADVSRAQADDLLFEMLLVDGLNECEAEQFRLAVRMFGGSHWSPKQAPAKAA